MSLCTDLIDHDGYICRQSQIFDTCGAREEGTEMGKGMVLDIPVRAIAQAVSRRLPTTAARVRAQVRSCGICGGHSSTGAGFLRVLRCPLPILIPPTAPHSSINRSWYNRPVSGRRTKWTRCHPTPRTKKRKRHTCCMQYQFRTY
jgi:hypothetical protein